MKWFRWFGFLGVSCILPLTAGFATEPPSISGVVTYHGTIGGTHKIEVCAHTALDQPPVACDFVDPGPTGPYKITPGPGTYYVYAVIDLNDSGGHPDPGEPVGFFDQDADGQPDTLTISEEISAAFIGIDIYDPAPVPALNAWGLTALALLFAGAGIWLVSNRRRGRA